MEQKELVEYLNKDVSFLKSLNFNDAYIKEIVQNTSKWAKIGFLQGIKDFYIGRVLASILENQYILNQNEYNSILPEGAEAKISEDVWFAQWKRCSIPVLRRTFGDEFIGFDLVSVQCMNRPSEDNLYFTDLNNKTKTTILSANTRMLGLGWDYPVRQISGSFLFDNREYSLGLDAESEAIAIFSQKLRDLFAREIIRDLAKAAGKSVVLDFEDVSQVLTYIDGMSSFIAAKCQNKEATWIVASSSVVDLLSDHIEFYEGKRQEKGVQKIGILNKKWLFIEDSTAPSGNILIGLKDPKNHYFSGYIFAPYLPVIPSLGWKSDLEDQKDYVSSRYSKKLTNPDFYGTIKVEKMPVTTQLDKDLQEAENGI